MIKKILTYQNPYEIDNETYWQDILRYPQLCVSQTMVNGMNSVYPFFKENSQLTTIRKFINCLYKDWESQDTNVKQLVEVDKAITSLAINSPNSENIKKSLLFNTQTIVKSIRIFSELGLTYDDFKQDSINVDQKYLLEIYKIIESNKDSSFVFNRNISENQINAALEQSLKQTENSDISKLDLNTVIIHGIHQFTPAILCAIEDLSKFKNVIFLFNYQKQYKSVYDTWLKIYSLFDVDIHISDDNQFTPKSLFAYSYKSNLLADFIGKISDGKYEEHHNELDDMEVTQFENLTEFANYCAFVYEKAKKKADSENNAKPVLAYMEDQFYSPSKKVNDILRAYFPEQFGERHFLDYPIGHFFVATLNLWDEDKHEVIVNNLSDIKECLQSGIIVESNKGSLLNTFNNVIAYFENENSLSKIILGLKRLKVLQNIAIPEKGRIAYFSQSNSEIDELIKGLEDLNNIIRSFFSEFDQSGGFSSFYKKIQKFIVSKIANMDDLDKEMVDVITKLLEKLKNSKLPDSGSYHCLRQTMSYYLSQDQNALRSANWIVRGFEQIDGDILRSKNQDPQETKYHFCCLSDKDICASNDEKMPWPLDLKFFETAHVPLDSKYQLFFKSKLEYKNFNRYALLYGLEFNRVSCKLSFIKEENDKQNDLYFVLRLLGAKIVKYNSYYSSTADVPVSISKPLHETVPNILDNYRASICPYKYALESVLQGKTMLRDRFLIHHYMRVVVRNRVLLNKQGMIFNENIIKKAISDEFIQLETSFNLSDDLEKTQLLSAVYSDIKSRVKKHMLPKLGAQDLKLLNLQLDLLYFDDKKINLLDNQSLMDLLNASVFEPQPSNYCMYCSSKDVCLEFKNK